MSYKKIQLNDGWKLGWKPDPVFNKWIVGFNNWRVEDGHLSGSPTFLTRGLIYANCDAPENYANELRLTLQDEKTDIRPVLCYCMTRLSGYYVILCPGQKITIYYAYSDIFDHHVAENVGPVLEAHKEYILRMERRGSKISLFLDGEAITEFEIQEYCGSYLALSAHVGDAWIHEAKVEELDSGELLFFDDFSSNSLPDHADVELDDLDCPQWIDAVVPGTVHTALLEAGIIEDPYLPFNGKKCHWVCDQRWVYKKKFVVPEDFRGARLRLLFHGVDYRGYFWLNGTKLCFHEGMFGGPELDITDVVDWEGENELTVCILPCPNPPHNNVRPYALHRWHFNMDIITSGLWQGVELIADDKIFLTDPQIITRCIRKDGTAVLDLGVTVSTMALWPFEVRGTFTLRSPDPAAEPLTAAFNPGFCQGSVRVKITLEVPNAKLWWPAGMGRQHLYDVDVSADLVEFLKQPEPIAHDELHLRTGIRTLRTAPIPPAGEMGVNNNPNGLYNWCFTVNGRPFFAKGTNWMPIDQMLRCDKEHYRRLLTRALDSNINMLRLWGAGPFETEDFFGLCDEMGICVWQETLFANGLYDGSKIEVWRETIRRSVCRIRNHPSLAIYCGGNEFDPDLPENRDIIDEIEGMIGELDPSRKFHRASPYGGDSHSYRANWMGGHPYTIFCWDHSTAITEYSQASPPCMDTLRRLIPQDELDAFPPDMPENIYRYDYTTWGREGVARKESSFSILDAHLSGITSIMFPSMSDAGKPSTMEEFVEYLQTTQGLLTQFGIGAWRARWPHCTAAMSWVFNVIFPDSMSWSYVDYFQMPKRSYYYQKRAFERIHATGIFEELFHPQGETLRIKLAAMNEELEPLENVTMNVRLYSTRLELLASQSKRLTLRADDVRNCGYFLYDIPADMPDQVLFLCVELVDASGKLLSRSHHCPRVGPRQEVMPYLANGPWISDVKHSRTSLSMRAEQDGGTLKVTVSNTGTLPAFQVYLHAPQMDHLLRYSDNCLWLEPGEDRIITIRSFEELPETLELSAWNADAIRFCKEDNR